MEVPKGRPVKPRAAIEGARTLRDKGLAPFGLLLRVHYNRHAITTILQNPSNLTLSPLVQPRFVSTIEDTSVHRGLHNLFICWPVRQFAKECGRKFQWVLWTGMA